MKYLSFGARGFACQLEKIDNALKLFGFKTGKKPAFIYANDPEGYEEAINAKIKYPKAKLILNVLDIPEHLGVDTVSNILETIKPRLAKADVVTCISHFVKAQIKIYLNLDAVVIYNPSEPISIYNGPKSSDIIYVGRANDPNKRFSLVLLAAQALGLQIRVVGTENPLVGGDNYSLGGFGVTYLGKLSVADLESEYRKARYCIFPSQIEGIGLPVMEAYIAGAIPIIANDNFAGRELLQDNHFVCAPTVEGIVEKYREFDIPKFATRTHPYIIEKIASRISLMYTLKPEIVALKIINLL